MGKLLQLPNEILALIAYAVPQEDIESYILSCRTVFLASLDILQRHRSSEIYSDAAIVSVGSRLEPEAHDPLMYLERL